MGVATSTAPPPSHPSTPNPPFHAEPQSRFCPGRSEGETRRKEFPQRDSTRLPSDSRRFPVRGHHGNRQLSEGSLRWPGKSPVIGAQNRQLSDDCCVSAAAEEGTSCLSRGHVVCRRKPETEVCCSLNHSATSASCWVRHNHERRTKQPERQSTKTYFGGKSLSESPRKHF